MEEDIKLFKSYNFVLLWINAGEFQLADINSSNIIFEVWGVSATERGCSWVWVWRGCFTRHST